MQDTTEDIDTPARDKYETYELLKRHIAETIETHDEYERWGMELAERIGV